MIKQNFNIHTHTSRCNHAIGKDEQYILAAIDAGMKTIGFSEHIAYPKLEIPGERMPNSAVDEYLRTMYALKEKYQDQIEILVGFEIEYFENQKDYLLEMKKRCDFMIVGQHYRYDEGYNYDYFNNDEDVIVYAKQIERALEVGLTRYIAHPDFLD
ncbi:MAG: PHP domain-containing protein [Thomasclavelia sp.]